MRIFAIKNRLSLIILLNLCLFIAHDAQAESLKVGLIAPLTGAVQQHGQAIAAGLKLGLQQANCSKSVAIFTEDDAYDPSRTVTAARKLIEGDRIQILLSVGSGPTHAIANLAERARIPVLALAGDSSVAMGRPFVVRLRKPAEDEGAEIADLAKRQGATRVALLCSQNEFTLSVCNGIQKSASSQIIFREDLTPDTSDFRVQILKFKSLQPTHIIPILVPGKLGLFAKQVRELGLSIPFLGGVFFESSSDIESSAGALVGAKYIMPNTSAEFQAAYAKLNSVAAGSIAWGAIFYDVGRILCSLGNSDMDPLSYLRSIKAFPGAVGEMSFRSQAGDQYFDYRFIEKTIRS